MEVCTTNNNSNEHHLTTTTSSSSNMLRGSPFQREVREWQRIDPTTGALLTGRLEADRWINGPLNSYGKISDSQNIAQPNGLQQTQRKQLEVLQSRTANGAMQVIRARTVQTTSSRWSSNNSSTTTSPITTAKTTTNGYHHSSNIFNNNSLITNGNHYNYNHSNNNSQSHMLQPLAPQLQISTVGSDVDCDIDDDVDVVVDDYTDVYDDDHVKQKEENHRLHLINQQRYNNNNNKSSSSIINNISNSNNLFSNFLLLDTAPSLKLSNLMKSSSSVSSNSNSSTATTASNMHASSSTSNSNKSGGKISLHTIVGNSNNYSDTLLSSTSPSSSTVTQQQQQQRSSRLYEQHPTFGKINSSSSSLIKSRVGGSSNDAADLSDVGEKQQQQHQLNHQQQPQTLTPTQQHRQQRRDLESFRHYNDDDQYNDDDDDADTLRLTARHQRRQQIPTTTSYSNITLQLGRSISNDDLSTEWDPHGDHSAHDEPSEWRRVSKLRRSFQSTAPKANSNLYSPTTKTTTSTTVPRRPLDLPESSVSVSKIRAELEAGRRLTTAMRNNHVDLAALQNILDAPTDNKPAISKRSSFLTAESLKEIRGKLKKLSDESLYKEDFITQNNEPIAQVEHIEVQHIRKPNIFPQISTTQRRSLISPERSPEIQRSAFQFVTPQQKRPTTLVTSNSGSTQKHTTNSLESRLKSRDTSSAEWHLRRKSYGFEKMSPPDDKSMLRMDASTDSGLGRSGELGNWSPTESASTTRGGTVVQFGAPARLVSNTAAIKRRQRPLRTSDADDSSDELKRHSIAVDESQYVRKTSQVHLNGLPSTVTESVSLEATRYDTDSPPNSSQLFQRSTQQKRVEFCKTEVHFAAESGRVNIVETDGKPPPTNNFRRRRRTTSGPLESLVTTTALVDSTPVSSSNIAMPVTRFGDDNRTRTISNSTLAYKAALLDIATAEIIEPTSVTVSLPKEPFAIAEGSRSSYTSTSGVDTTDNENDEIAAIRGILKNKPIKPKPYHLGENFDSPDALWGVQLKPIGSLSPLQTKRESYDPVTKTISPPAQALSRSVAERVRIVERRQDTSTTQAQANGYSTKINLSLGETSPEWKPEQDLPKSNLMSIELHSPQATLEKPAKVAPVAKPRTLPSATKQQYEADSNRSMESTKEQLKIIKEARGARKLRVHELSYFGVQVPSSQTANPTKTKPQQTAIQTSRRTLPQRHRVRDDTTKPTETRNERQTTKWNLINDKPDLLRHSPVVIEPRAITRTAQFKSTDKHQKKIFSPVKRIQYSDDDVDADEDDEHFYENITNEISSKITVKAPPSTAMRAYNRKTDLERDERILSEMTHTADQTMKALSDEAAIKDQRRRSSLTQRSSKPLETITEKSNDAYPAVKVSRSTMASEAKRSSRHSTPSPTPLVVCSRIRTSSQSSNESCPRARSRSLSSEREYENVKVRPTARSTKLSKSAIKPSSRSSSRDSQRSSHTPQCSSGDEQQQHNCRRDERLRTKTKRISSSSVTKAQQEARRQREHERKEQQQRAMRASNITNNASSHKEKSKSGSTTRSSQRERVECATTDSSRRHKREGELDPHRRSSSSRRATVTTEKHDEKRSGNRLVRSMRASHHHDDAVQRSSNRSEHSVKEIDRERLSKSKGHSSQSTQQHSSSNDHSHHQQHQQQHNSSPSASSAYKARHHSSNSGEQKKSKTNGSQHHDSTTAMTHSKNAQILNGINAQQQQHYHQHPQRHVHSMTTATITAKQRERHGKDRK